MGNLLSVESQKVTEIKGRSFPFPSASISSAPRRLFFDFNFFSKNIFLVNLFEKNQRCDEWDHWRTSNY